MRKIGTVVGVVALMTMLFAGVALAVNKQCGQRPCEGTNSGDTLFERGGDGVNDTIYGRGGPDVIRAEIFTNDTDVLYGGRGNDRLNTNDGDANDTVFGGGGFDVCIIDAGDSTSGCEDVRVDPGETAAAG